MIVRHQDLVPFRIYSIKVQMIPTVSGVTLLFGELHTHQTTPLTHEPALFETPHTQRPDTHSITVELDSLSPDIWAYQIDRILSSTYHSGPLSFDTEHVFHESLSYRRPEPLDHRGGYLSVPWSHFTPRVIGVTGEHIVQSTVTVRLLGSESSVNLLPCLCKLFL
jgi:hypothetical protein